MTKINGGNILSQMLNRSLDVLAPKGKEQKAQVNQLVQNRTEGGFESQVKNQTNLLLGRQSTITSTKKQDGTAFKDTSQFVNGRLRSTDSFEKTTEGNLTSSTRIERGFGRDGLQSRERVTSELVTKYGDHSTIGRTQVTDGSFHSDAIKYTNTQGDLTRSTTVTNSSGANTTSTKDGSLQYKGGSYLNNGKYGNGRWTNGRFESTHGKMYTNETRNQTQTTLTRDTRGAETRGTEADKARLADHKTRGQRLGLAQKGLDIAGDMGLRTTLAGGGKRTTNAIGAEAVKTKSADGRTTTETLLGPRASTTRFGEVTLGADGLRARGDVDARAGLYAEASGKHKTELGTLSGSAGAKAEVFASANGQATLNLNGLDAKGYVGVGAEVSAEATGSFRLPGITIGGQKVDAGISATGRVAAEAKAEASGRVQFTGNPPRAVISGEAGASAVVKAEGEAKLDAGPFSVRAQGYVSAGAEAQANGSIGYDDGKLSLSFGAGAALGIGAGGRVQLTVDVKQIGEIAGGLATDAYKSTGLKTQVDKLDVTGDNEFNMKDVKVIGKAAVDTAKDVAKTVGNAAKDVGNAVGNAAEAVGGAVTSGAKAVKEFFSGW